MKHHFHLLINSNSGSGNGRLIGERAIALLAQKQMACTAYFTEKAGDEKNIALNLAQTVLLPYEKQKPDENFPLLVVIGGDGTLSHVVDALIEFPHVPIAYIPAGSGNDFSRATGIFTKNTDEALANILSATMPVLLPVLESSETLAPKKRSLVNSFGIGIDGAVIRYMEQSTFKKRMNKFGLGSLAYPFSLLNVLFHQRPFTATIQTEGTFQTFEEIFLLTVTNHQYFGGGINIVPKAHIQKEGIDIIIIQKKSWWRIIQIMVALLQGKHLKHQDVHHFSGKSIQVQVKTPQHAQADGELMEFHPFDLRFKQTFRYFWFKSN